LSGAALTIAIMLPLLASELVKTGSLPKALNKKPIAFDLKINRLDEASFGKLALSSAPAQGGSAGAVYGLGGGGASAPLVRDAEGKLMPIDMKNYTFVYKGGEFAVPEMKDVLKRIKGVNANLDVTGIARVLNLGAVNTDSFPGLDLQNINLVQRDGFGYALNINLDEGAISINQNGDAWLAKCQVPDCSDQRMKKEDVLPDEEVIRIADNFISEHGIDMSHYDRPRVSDDWVRAYMSARAKDDFYIPESAEVVYPLKINQEKVFDEYSGKEQGLSLTVNHKLKKVMTLYGLNTENYDSSAYSTVNDRAKIIEIAEKGGFNYFSYPEAKKTVALELGDPQMGYIRYYDFRDGKNSELLVPALSFPIRNLPESDPNFYRNAIVVPIISDIFNERLNNMNPVPELKIMQGGGREE